MKKVGILGGMGPEATVLLMQKLIDAVDAKDDDHHVPLIVHQNTQVPSRIRAIIDGTGPDPTEVLTGMAIELEQIGCELLAMPCNTAHYYYSELSKSVKIPVLNMIRLSSVELTRKKQKDIGILASPAVKRVGLFESYFQFYGLNCVFSENDEALIKIITETKKGNFNSEVTEQFLNEVSELQKIGCDGLLIACTEFSLLSSQIKNIDVLDSLDCLTKEIISFSKSRR